MRRLLAVPLIIVLALGAAGCWGDDGNATSTASTPVASDLGLITPGALSVAADFASKPLVFTEPGSSRAVGFNVDLVDAIAATLGIENVTFVKQAANPIPLVREGRFDMSASPFSITPERARQVAFGAPYFKADQSVMVQAGSHISGLDDLQGKTIGVQRGTTGADLAATVPDATVKRYYVIEHAFTALAQGRVDGVLNDFSTSAYEATRNPRLEVAARVPTRDVYGLVFPKDNSVLRDAFDTGLATIKANGTYDEIYMKWFGEAPPVE